MHTPTPEVVPSLVINVPEWFEDPEFIEWLNNQDNRLMTWHRHDEPVSEMSDVVVFVDPGLSGAGTDEGEMPERYWNAVVDACRKALSPRPRFSSHIPVRLTNLQE